MQNGSESAFFWDTLYISRAKWRNIFVTVIFDGRRQAFILVAAETRGCQSGVAGGKERGGLCGYGLGRKFEET